MSVSSTRHEKECSCVCVCVSGVRPPCHCVHVRARSLTSWPRRLSHAVASGPIVTAGVVLKLDRLPCHDRAVDPARVVGQSPVQRICFACGAHRYLFVLIEWCQAALTGALAGACTHALAVMPSAMKGEELKTYPPSKNIHAPVRSDSACAKQHAQPASRLLRATMHTHECIAVQRQLTACTAGTTVDNRVHVYCGHCCSLFHL